MNQSTAIDQANDPAFDPVGVVLKIREEVTEFRRTSSKQAYRAALRVALDAALRRQAVVRRGPDMQLIVKYLDNWEFQPRFLPAVSRNCGF
jgi:hypothetical protein